MICDLCCINCIKKGSVFKDGVAFPLGTVVTKNSTLEENTRKDPALFLKNYFLCMIKSLFHLF